MSTFRLEINEKFVREDQIENEPNPPLHTFKYKQHLYLQGKKKFNKKDIPIVFKVTPETLEELCLLQIDKFELVNVYNWSSEDVAKWLRNLGYRQYVNTFYENQIEGQKLLLLDASALCAMNIQRFDHIKHIAAAIRQLFFYVATTFARSISLSKEFFLELYELFRLKTGPRYELIRRSNLLRRMQLVHQRPRQLTHWQRLEEWLQPALQQPPQHKQLVAGIWRQNLYHVQPRTAASSTTELPGPCTCMPPCDCCWNERSLCQPWRLYCLRNLDKPPPTVVKTSCSGSCQPPCICNWSYRDFNEKQILTLLDNHSQYQYGSSAHRPNMKFNASQIHLAKTRSVALLHRTTPSDMRLVRTPQQRISQISRDRLVFSNHSMLSAIGSSRHIK